MYLQPRTKRSSVLETKFFSEMNEYHINFLISHLMSLYSITIFQSKLNIITYYQNVHKDHH